MLGEGSAAEKGDGKIGIMLLQYVDEVHLSFVLRYDLKTVRCFAVCANKHNSIPCVPFPATKLGSLLQQLRGLL